MRSWLLCILFQAIFTILTFGFRFAVIPNHIQLKIQTAQPAVTLNLGEHNEESTESVVKRFKKCVNRQGYMLELRHRVAHESAGDKVKRKRQRFLFKLRMRRNNLAYLKQIYGGTETEYNT